MPLKEETPAVHTHGLGQQGSAPTRVTATVADFVAAGPSGAGGGGDNNNNGGFPSGRRRPKKIPGRYLEGDGSAGSEEEQKDRGEGAGRQGPGGKGGGKKGDKKRRRAADVAASLEDGAGGAGRGGGSNSSNNSVDSNSSGGSSIKSKFKERHDYTGNPAPQPQPPPPPPPPFRPPGMMGMTGGGGGGEVGKPGGGGRGGGGEGGRAGGAVAPQGPTSTFRGVRWSKQQGRWRVDVHYKGKDLFLAYFNDEIEAARVFDDAASTLYEDGEEEGRKGGRAGRRLGWPEGSLLTIFAFSSRQIQSLIHTLVPYCDTYLSLSPLLPPFPRQQGYS